MKCGRGAASLSLVSSALWLLVGISLEDDLHPYYLKGAARPHLP